MIFHPTSLPDAFIIDVEPFQDERGFFARTFCQQEFRKIGHSKPFVQINHSMTYTRASIRGMHYQVAPYAEVKLIRCIRGSIWDVIIDVRKDSPTFLMHVGVELSESNKRMLYVPEGFAHGFQTLSDDAEIIYHHTAYYHPASERGISYDDARVGIEWPLPEGVISEKDQTHAPLSEHFTGHPVSDLYD